MSADARTLHRIHRVRTLQLTLARAEEMRVQGAVATGGGTAGLPPKEAAALRASVSRMSALAQENRAAIERGVALQMRVIQAIAAAVPRARAVEAPVYQPDGSKTPPRPPEAYAFLSRM